MATLALCVAPLRVADANSPEEAPGAAEAPSEAVDEGSAEVEEVVEEVVEEDSEVTPETTPGPAERVDLRSGGMVMGPWSRRRNTIDAATSS